MKKSMVAGVIGVLAASGIYLGGVYFSGQQASQYMETAMEKAQTAVQGQGFIHNESQLGFFSSHYRITYTLASTSDEFAELLGTREVPFHVLVKHRFLGADFVITLLEGELASKLKSVQANHAVAPIRIESSQRFSPFSQQMSVDAVINTDKFIVKDEDSGDEATIGAVTLDYSQDGRDFTLDFVMQDSGIVGEDGQLAVQGISGTESGVLDHEDAFQALMAESLEALFNVKSIDLKTQEGNFAVNDLTLLVSQQPESDRMLTRVVYSAGSIDATKEEQTFSFNDANFGISFNLDTSATRGLVEQLNQLNPEDQEAMMQQMDALVGAADQLTLKGIQAQVEDLSVRQGELKAEANAALELAPFKVSDVMMMPTAAIQYLTLDATAQFPAAMVNQLPDYNPEQLERMVDMGFLQKTPEGDYRAELKINKGEATLNGQPMPM